MTWNDGKRQPLQFEWRLKSVLGGFDLGHYPDHVPSSGCVSIWHGWIHNSLDGDGKTSPNALFLRTPLQSVQLHWREPTEYPRQLLSAEV